MKQAIRVALGIPAMLQVLRFARGMLLCGVAMLTVEGAEKQVPGHPEDTYGRTLTEVGRLGVGPVIDAAVEGNFLYVIGDGKLHVAELGDPAHPRLLATVKDLGNTRQIEVDNGIAYVTSREDGLFLLDVRTPAAPVALSHYDSIELATGIAVSGNVAFIALRTYGVELVDVSDPKRPLHLSTVRTGEAQSVVARDGILYVGVWGTRELVVCDVRDPRKPVILSKAPLDGYGDGVDVRGRHCFVATGHHSRELKKNDPSDPAFGSGHGLELLDVSDPAKPVFVSRLKLPRFYSLGNDMWDVEVAGKYAFVCDTYNGLFVIDVSDPAVPRFVAHRQLDYVPKRKQFSHVGGFALGRDHVYVAGGLTDLHVLAAAGLARHVGREKGQAPAIPPEPATADPRFHGYQPGGQVYAAALSGTTAFVAAGNAGLHVVELGDGIKKLSEYPTEGFAVDVKVARGLVWVAESKGGLKILKWEGGALKPVGRYCDAKYPVKQVVVPSAGPYALLHIGSGHLHIVDASAPESPKLALKDTRLGILYGYQISEGLLENRWALCFWHVSGFHWYDLGGAAPTYAGNSPGRMQGADGAVFLGNTALATARGGYFLLGPVETESTETKHVITIPGHPVSGKPSLFGNTLYVSDRFLGMVHAVDVSDVEHPRWLRTLELEGNPGLVLEHQGRLVIPAGYQGLLLEK